ELHYPDGRKTGLDLNKVVNFDGGESVDGKLRNGPIKDFNVMVDRRHYKAHLEIASGPKEIGKTNL
ncbi:MAG: HutD family protein, partial [Rhodospirillales bacterium]|nr:HutD family protein [Rhodospirillales bacterium]